MSFELIVVVVVFVMIFNITTKMQKKIEIDRINSMIQKTILYFIIEQNDISISQKKMIIKNVDENFNDEFYVESIEHHEKKNLKSIKLISLIDSKSYQLLHFFLHCFDFFYVDFHLLNKFLHRLKKLLNV